MHLRWILSALIFLCGCTVQVQSYIKSDHPYARKLYGNYDKIVLIIKEVLAQNKYKILSETHPSVYERSSDENKETPEDLLLFTDIKQHPMLLYSSYTHLNIFIHAETDGAQVELRYGKTTSFLVKQINSTRNDKLANRLLDQMEQELLETK